MPKARCLRAADISAGVCFCPCPTAGGDLQRWYSKYGARMGTLPLQVHMNIFIREKLFFAMGLDSEYPSLTCHPLKPPFIACWDTTQIIGCYKIRTIQPQTLKRGGWISLKEGEDQKTPYESTPASRQGNKSTFVQPCISADE